MTTPSPLYIVGLGASAGGIEALEGFFAGVPAELDAAYLITTHLSPDRHSLLTEIVRRFTSLPVVSAVDGSPITSRQVYVMPEATVMTVAEGRIKLHQQGIPRERKPVDILLGSLAESFNERAVGIILSGGDTDGTLGLKAIKAFGGITMAQVADGYGPAHHGMPDSAIAAGVADFCLPANAMGPKLLALSQADALVAAADAADAAAPIEGAMAEDRLQEIYALLRSQVGHDFSGYKSKTFIRRVLRRMQVADAASVNDYIAFLRSDAKEVNALFRDLLINVTSFFRDTEAFDALASTVIPKLFEDKGASDLVRIWVPGCATGEEVYSLAILVLEHLDTLSAPCRVQIFATDIDDRALAVARAARYPQALMDAVSDARRQRFFSFENEAFIVSKRVRDLCIFSPHSVIRDPPFSRIDLVSCRNLLIYFGADAQNQVIPIFHYALRPGGFLFLGSAENVTQFGELFEATDKRHRIFRRRSDGTPNLRLPILVGQARGSRSGELVPRRLSLSGMALRQVVDQQVLERFGPPHVVVNRDGDVIFYSTRTGKYLEPPAGAPTRQLLTMARKDLRLDLRTLFREALETGRPTSRAGINVELDDLRIQVLSVHIEPLRDNTGGAPLFLVLFVDQMERPPRSTSGWGNDFGDEVRGQMERELHETRDRLQSMIEEYETALEELKSSNEELVSVNEEMQSTNEELEASKEEMQSLNEELSTVNGELHGKLDSLDRANSDLVNLFAATNVATIFLDQKLVIRTFTPAVSSVFNIRGTDRGRPITDLSSQLVLPTLTEDIARVFKDKEPLEKTARNEDGTAHFLVRLAPYVDALARIEGVVATFLDVTSLTVSEARQRTMVAELQHRTRNLLTIVETIARKTLSDNAQLNQFAVRLGALSRVQGLIGGRVNEAIDLGDILRLEMEAHSASAPKVSMRGPHVPLGYDAAQTMCLALHELTTNAVKYGALKASDGKLDISWHLDGDGEASRLSFLWKERGVPRAAGPVGTGFGRELIERALAFTLRATVSWQLEDDGVRCQIDLPLASSGPQR